MEMGGESAANFYAYYQMDISRILSMKIVLRVAVLVVVLFVVMNYFGYQTPSITPIEKWFSSATEKAKNLLPKNESTQAKESVKISKWTDEKGVVHYENRPVDGAKTIDVDPNANVLSLEPVAEMPKPEDENKPKTYQEEVQALQKAKDAHMERLINN